MQSQLILYHIIYRTISCLEVQTPWEEDGVGSGGDVGTVVCSVIEGLKMDSCPFLVFALVPQDKSLVLHGASLSLSLSLSLWDVCACV
jgi:hypothetical protein